MATARRGGDRRGGLEWAASHCVEVVFALIAAFWFFYVLHLSRGFSFWSDDLRLVQQGGSWRGMLRPYDNAPAVVTMVVNRLAAEAGGLSYWPFALAGALAFVSVPVVFFFTTKRQLGAPLAAILAMPLLWCFNIYFRPAQLNHMCALAAGMVCAAALNRGRRADWILAAALLVSLFSAGAGIVVAGACVIHSALVRAHLRRWLAVLVPGTLCFVWYIVARPASRPHGTLTTRQQLHILRNVALEPFHQVGFKFWPLAIFLVIAFLAWGALQLRQGLAAGANFVAWLAAEIAWIIGLLHTRGPAVNVFTFRYVYVALGFVLLAVVPRKPIKWPQRMSVANPRWLAVAVLGVLAFAGIRAAATRPGFERFGAASTRIGQQAKATMLVLRLRPSVVPNRTPIPFFGYGNPHGTAGEARALMARYGSPLHPTIARVDQQIVDLDAAQVHVGAMKANVDCQPLTGLVKLAPTSQGEAALGVPAPGSQSLQGPAQYTLWTKRPVTIWVQRFGDHPVQLAELPAHHLVSLTLSVLSSTRPWTVTARGACVLPP